MKERVLQAKASFYEGKVEQAAVAGEREGDACMAIEAKLLYLEQTEETLRLQQLAKQAVLDLELRVLALKEEKAWLQEKWTELITRVRQMSRTSGYHMMKKR